MSDETRPDREALACTCASACEFWLDEPCNCSCPKHTTYLPAPHPHGGTEALRDLDTLHRAAIRGMRFAGGDPLPIDKAACRLRALLAAAPAPTEAGTE